MALQSGIGVSKLIVMVGAGYTSVILFQNGKLSDLLGELQSILKGLEKSGETGSDADYYESISSQVKRLGMEVRQLASTGQITVFNGNAGQLDNISSLLVPAVALGALGYGYMWWKGFKFSDLMYVTKRNMANAVANLTKHLERVTDTLEVAKKHLTQRIENLDGKIDKQRDVSKLIREEVTEVRSNLSQIGYDLDALQRMVSGMDGKICSLESKQDFANKGVLYLCSFVTGKKLQMPDHLQNELKLAGKAGGFLKSSEFPSIKGLKEILALGDADSGDKAKLNDQQPRNLTTAASLRC